MEDLPDLVTFANNEKIARNLTDAFPFPYTEEAGRGFLEVAMGSKNMLYAIDLKGRAIGGVGIHFKTDVYRYTAEIGYWLAEPYWRKGIMTEALKQLIKIAFTKTSLQRLEASIYEYNISSQKTMQKLGFTMEGLRKDYTFKSGNFYDSYLYRLLKPEAQSLGYLS
jgi:RimJ/RimL family protein N-acetyltransferase